MIGLQIRGLRIQAFISVTLIVVLSSCGISPGRDVYQLHGTSQSTLELPGPIGSGQPPKNVKVQAITPELIVRDERIRNEQLKSQLSQKNLTENEIESYSYVIGPGDVLNITVWDHPELTIPAGSFRGAGESGNLVSNDGTIYFAFAGVVNVSGLTQGEVRDVLAKKLSYYIESVQVDVRVIQFRNQRIYVVGEVRTPGLQVIDDIPPTIAEMINRAGGFSAEADRRYITLTRDGKTYLIDMLAYYEEGDSSQNILLKDRDVVNVWDRQLNKVFVLGEVLNTGSYIMNKHRKSLAEALSDAGGVVNTTSNPGRVYVFRGGGKQSEIYHLDTRSPDALILADRFPLRARDVVYVDSTDLERWDRVIQQISGTVELMKTISETPFSAYPGRILGR